MSLACILQSISEATVVLLPSRPRTSVEYPFLWAQESNLVLEDALP